MERTPAPISLAAAHELQPLEGSRAAEVFRDNDDDVWIRFAARPTSGPQVPHDRDEFYIVASGIARYRWDGGETMIGPGDMMFTAAHKPHGYDQFSEDFSVWVVLWAAKICGGPMTDDTEQCRLSPMPQVARVAISLAPRSGSRPISAFLRATQAGSVNQSPDEPVRSHSRSVENR
jgi:mannose-6-phosphate isomerase-like protein (cupin superfamily)